MLIPRLDFMQCELASAKDLVQTYHNLSTTNSLIDLVASLEIKIQVLESVRTTWDHDLSM